MKQIKHFNVIAGMNIVKAIRIKSMNLFIYHSNTLHHLREQLIARWPPLKAHQCLSRL